MKSFFPYFDADYDIDPDLEGSILHGTKRNQTLKRVVFTGSCVVLRWRDRGIDDFQDVMVIDDVLDLPWITTYGVLVRTQSTLKF